MHLAYVAGIIDGEGCINFTRARTSVFPRILVANTNLELLISLQKQFGGDIKKLSRHEGWKQGYSWRLSWSAAVRLLDKVEKYLRVKDDQAAAVFAWNAIRPGKGKRTEDKVLEHREATEFLVWHMHKLNAKGGL